MICSFALFFNKIPFSSDNMLLIVKNLRINFAISLFQVFYHFVFTSVSYPAPCII